MKSEYEKMKEQMEQDRKNPKGSSRRDRGKKKEGEEREKRADIDEKELEAKMSEAERLDLCMLDPEEFAQQLTYTEVKILMDITPVEILQFSYENEEAASPTIAGYLRFTNGLSSYVTASILECMEEAQDKVSAKKKFHGQSEAAAAQTHWKDVMKRLLDKNNRNSIGAVFRGIMKTSPSRILKEEISDILREASDAVSHQTEKGMQATNLLYIRDVKTLEKHLIDASYNKGDKESPNKFKRIIEYLNYIRSHSQVEVDKKINHAIMHTLKNAKDVRISAAKDSSVFYTGCFLFLEHSSFIALE
ncbi:uncharacterized protein NEMAJ01_1266 [Nematocida major]|uniref:uncharacterized protein n=1 Tax=Nematocida major TaxID=1912982 RepID=UPI002008A664|nr:uncharacterized protein NEMAJ01_1266 [Nematocida major]KAH9386370.1 hypothetical protein NEMAJ01_1266 [Nematocida major]